MAESTPVDTVLHFECDQSVLWGVLSRPPEGAAESAIAVVIVVGGPQYRVGSHRQFVHLGRSLARRGYPVLRFDYRGMGDSEGDRQTFEDTESDLRAAIDAVCAACPGIRRVVVWGLCDAASAALMFASHDSRVLGIVAANPWARSEASLATTHVKHYYGARLLQLDFWTRLLLGRFDWRASCRSLMRDLRLAAGRTAQRDGGHGREPFQVRMANGLAAFNGRVLLVLSGNDLTAKEFLEYASGATAWRGLLTTKVQRVDLPEADHTFSRRTWLDRVADETLAWLQTLEPTGGPRADFQPTTTTAAPHTPTNTTNEVT